MTHLGIISSVDSYRNIMIITSKFLINFNYFNNFNIFLFIQHYY